MLSSSSMVPCSIEAAPAAGALSVPPPPAAGAAAREQGDARGVEHGAVLDRGGSGGERHVDAVGAVGVHRHLLAVEPRGLDDRPRLVVAPPGPAGAGAVWMPSAAAACTATFLP